MTIEMNEKSNMSKKITFTRLLGVAAVAIVTLGTSGCAITSKDQYGNDCVIGQTCPGLLVRPTKAGTIVEGMTVIGVHKPGSDVWNNAIRTDAIAFGMAQDAMRQHAGNRDFVQVRKMGFMYAVNKHGGLYAEGLNVGDVVDVAATEKPINNYITRIVKRAGD